MTAWEKQEKRLRRRLAANVRALRTTRGLTLEAIAHDVAMSWRHWQKVEGGEHGVTLRTLAKIAVALDVEPADLLRSR